MRVDMGVAERRYPRQVNLWEEWDRLREADDHSKE
jgi:hypothetical protein